MLGCLSIYGCLGIVVIRTYDHIIMAGIIDDLRLPSSAIILMIHDL